MQPCVCILASRRNGTLYIGVTSDIASRAAQHRSRTGDGFAAKHGVITLVHLERHDTMADAIAREKQLKKWRRAWKLELIEANNPQWRDLFETINA